MARGLKMTKLRASSFISSEVGGVGEHQLTSDGLQPLVGAILLSSFFSLPLFSSSFSLSPFSSLSFLLLSWSVCVSVRVEREWREGYWCM